MPTSSRSSTRRRDGSFRLRYTRLRNGGWGGHRRRRHGTSTRANCPPCQGRRPRRHGSDDPDGGPRAHAGGRCSGAHYRHSRRRGHRGLWWGINVRLGTPAQAVRMVPSRRRRGCDHSTRVRASCHTSRSHAARRPDLYWLGHGGSDMHTGNRRHCTTRRQKLAPGCVDDERVRKKFWV